MVGYSCLGPWRRPRCEGGCTVQLAPYVRVVILTMRVVAPQVGTPLCIPSQRGLDLGRIASIELNHKPVQPWHNLHS